MAQPLFAIIWPAAIPALPTFGSVAHWCPNRIQAHLLTTCASDVAIITIEGTSCYHRRRRPPPKRW
jgi:hypothetical protein